MQFFKSTKRDQQQSGLYVSAILLMVLPLFATVASVPTSVLAQNSELSTNMNNKNEQNNYMQLSKVKRSSDNSNKENASGSSSTLAPSSMLDKKSSPEIVPSSFSNLPPVNKLNGGNSAANQAQVASYKLPSNREIMAAVEAAAAVAATQRQQQQQPQQYGGMDVEDLDALPTSSMHKRGIAAQQYLYDNGLGVNGPYVGSSDVAAAGDYYGPNSYVPSSYGMVSDIPNGVWADEYEPAPLQYGQDLQELGDYIPVQHVNNAANSRSKAYDNLQNLLNTEAYLESIPLSVPLQYSNRNYGALDGDRNKRGGYYNPSGGSTLSFGGNLNKYYKNNEMRNHKRDNTKLTPADMLALVALVEAGERARKETDADAGYLYPSDNYAPKSYATATGTGASGSGVGGLYDYMAGGAAPLEDVDYGTNNAGNGNGNGNGNWLDAPAIVDYYGNPVNVDTMPKYDYLQREHKYGNGNRYGGSSKRFMVAKKKRSVSKYLNNDDKYY